MVGRAFRPVRIRSCAACRSEGMQTKTDVLVRTCSRCHARCCRHLAPNRPGEPAACWVCRRAAGEPVG